MVTDHSNRTAGPGSAQRQVFLEVEPISSQQPNSAQPQLCITIDQRLELRVDSDRGVNLAVSFIAALDSANVAQRAKRMLNQAGGAL